MRAKDVIRMLQHELDSKDDLIAEFREENARLRAALLANTPAAPALRPRKEAEEKPPLTRPIGL